MTDITFLFIVENQLVWLIGDFFVAGTETVSTAIKWGVMFLLNDFDVQCKMRKEIEHVVGKSRLPQLSKKNTCRIAMPLYMRF